MRPPAGSRPEPHRRWRPRVALNAGLLLLFALGAGGPAWAAGAERPSEIIWDPAAEPSWAHVFGGTGASADQALDVAIAASGAAYVAGVVNYGPSADASLMKVVGGALAWPAPKTYNSPPGGADLAAHIAIGPGNTIYTAGESYDAGGFTSDILLIRWSTSGTVKWAKRYNGSVSDTATSIGVDSAGNVTVCGVTDNDWVVVSWNKSGERRWVKRIEAPAGESAAALDLVVAPDNSIYVTGTYHEATATRCLTARYSSAGGRAWKREYQGPAGLSAWAGSIARCPDGGVYIAGTTEGATTQDDGLVVRYTTRGERDVFTPDAAGGGASDEHIRDIAVAANGQVAAVGTTTTAGNSNCRAVLFTPDGTIASQATLPGAWYDELTAVETDAFGGCYATGRVHVAADRTAIITWRFSAITGGGGFLSLWMPAFVTDHTMAHAIAVSGVTACVAGQTDEGGGLGTDQVALGWSY